MESVCVSSKSFNLKKGNHKLSNKIGIWTLPRSSCIGAGACLKYCYARTFEKCPSVEKSREKKLSQSKCSKFGENISSLLSDGDIKYVRVHESGDFYCGEYLEKWKQIARNNPEVVFYAYTKSTILDLYKGLPSNFIIFQSFGGLWDGLIKLDKPTARVISDASKKFDNEYLCPYGQEEFTKCGECCSYCMDTSTTDKHVAFVIHGAGHKKKKACDNEGKVKMLDIKEVKKK